MKVFSRLEDIPALERGTAAAIGNFDGIHLGHQQILRFLVDQSQKKNLLSLVLTFFPHPDQYFGKKPFNLIQTLNQRLQEIERNGIDAVIVLTFGQSTANLASQDFIKKIMIGAAQAKTIVVGENFRFGKNREGSIRIFEELAEVFNFEFFSIPSLKKNGKVISSSWIRALLKEGEIKQSNSLLGRPYEITGTVVKGMSRGKNLGFPTANLLSTNELLPEGVFLTKVKYGETFFPALTNIGIRPTFGQKRMNIESHILDFSGDLYGRTLGIQFYSKLRDEINFKTPELLLRQMNKDLISAKKYFQLM